MKVISNYNNKMSFEIKNTLMQLFGLRHIIGGFLIRFFRTYMTT